MEDKLLNNYINHLNKVKRDDIHFQDVSHLLIFMRLIIEKENLKDKYPNISFFSDWYLHTKIDRNRFAKERLDSIYQLMQSKFLLDKEILNFFSSMSISSNFNDEIYLTNFLRLYLSGICERPLIFQSNTSEIFHNIKIKGFQFIEVENKIWFEILTSLDNKLFVFKFLNKIKLSEK